MRNASMRDALPYVAEHAMSVLADREILPLRDPKDALECARMMAGAEPWITLGISPELAHVIVSDSARQLFLVRDDRGVAAFIILDMRGLLAGYIGVLCVREDRRRHGLGTALIEWAEARIFKSSPNVFICVSSFNTGARRLYRAAGLHGRRPAPGLRGLRSRRAAAPEDAQFLVGVSQGSACR